VFVVGHLGDWQRAAKVLFERESVRRDSPPSREARQGVAGGVGGSVANGSAGVTPHIFKVRGGVEREDGSRGSTNIGKQAGKGYLGSEERAFTLAAAQDQFVAQPVAFHANAQACQLPGPARDTSISDSLTRSQQAAVAQPVAIGLDEEQNACVEGFGTLKARMEGGGFEGSVMTPAMQVRRLTPVECERLQGFPDGYTNIPWRKKPEAPDGPRYKALGNSMAVPCMAWIGKRIAEVDNDPLA
jgi:DNA (cytosine-5)-methyltransferase 1